MRRGQSAVEARMPRLFDHRRVPPGEKSFQTSTPKCSNIDGQPLGDERDTTATVSVGTDSALHRSHVTPGEIHVDCTLAGLGASLDRQGRLWVCNQTGQSHLVSSGVRLSPRAFISHFQWQNQNTRMLLLHVLVLTVLCTCTRAWMTRLGSPFRVICPRGNSLVGLSSVHSSWAEDRIWDFRCAQTDTTEECEWNTDVNEFDEPLLFQCGDNGAVRGISAYFSIENRDRRFSYLCCKIRNSFLTTCTFTDFLNDFDGGLNFLAPIGQVINGFFSLHDNEREDRIWRVEVCEVRPEVPAVPAVSEEPVASSPSSSGDMSNFERNEILSNFPLPSSLPQNGASPAGTTDQVQPASGTTNQVQPVSGTTNQVQPVSGTTNQVHPVWGTTNQVQPVSGTTNQVQPVSGTTNQVQPVSGTTNQVQPVWGTTNQVQPVSGTTNQMQPGSGTTNQVQPVWGTTNQVQPVSGTTNQMQPGSGTTNQVQPVWGTTNQVQPVSGTTNQMQPVSGTTNQVQPVLGTTNQMQPIITNQIQPIVNQNQNRFVPNIQRNGMNFGQNQNRFMQNQQLFAMGRFTGFQQPNLNGMFFRG
ncbi:uncharacterized protein LOC124137769 [Haliotis rufescens]|uniref:uncharacterized protein LOC124137769 n=1 Tax=Haliotis rufescens TaxID=6454 RepID=UPI00201EA71B|nr:uncharacterized protein LOC124137769 [Haliotis rufescens]